MKIRVEGESKTIEVEISVEERWCKNSSRFEA